MAENTHRNSLKTGHKIGPYEIISVLGQGGFGITYLAKDLNLNREVAIKEYLPVELAVRDTNTSVYPVSGEHGEQFNWGLERFISEAQTLARFKHPNIVRVLTILRENNTAYIVMEYEHGVPLHVLLKDKKILEENELKKMLYPILDGLEEVHKAGFIHRDIKPPNIYIREDNSPVLIDFGSARQSLFEYTRTLTTMVSPGYAPFEQYVGKSDKQGPWTDIYGLGATLYRAVTGVSPQDSMDRSEAILHTGRDIYVRAAEIAGNKYSPAFLEAIDKAMAFKTDDRPQTIAEWRKMLEGEIPCPGPDREPLVVAEAATEKVSHGTGLKEESPAVSSGMLDRMYGLVKRVIKWGLILLVVLIVIGVLKNTRHKTEQQVTSRIQDEMPAANVEQPQDTSNGQPVVTEPRATEPSREKIIEDLLEKAEQNISSLSLTTPPGDNALEKYRRVLEMEPGNRRALDGIDRIVDEYIILMDNAIRNDSFARAGEFLHKAESVNPEHPAIAPARTRLASALKAHESPATKITDTPAPAPLVAEEPETGTRIPADEQQQIDSIRERLRANPDDRQARRDLRDLANTFEQNIRQAVNEGNYDLARAYVYEVQKNTDKNARAYKRLRELLKIIDEKEKAGR